MYKLRGTYFRYVSVSTDQKNMSTFVYHGYTSDKTAISGEASLTSSTPIKFFSDQYTFFVAVSDNDVYTTVMLFDSVSNSYIAWSRTFKKSIVNNTLRASYIA